MAAVHVTDEDAFCCSVCLHTLKDPVTIPCGHSYCKGCISGYWDHKDGKGEYSCPQCRETFSSKPVLNKNTVLAELVVKMKGNGAEKQSHPVAEEVPCDICTGEKKTCAVKTCLVCLVSLCQTHIQPHYEFAAYKRHKLVKALTNLQEKICPLHDKLLEVFCLTDQSYICMLCTVDEHKGHETTSVISEMRQKQKQLGEQQRELKKHIELKEKELQELENAVEDYRSSAEAAVLETDRIFAEVIQSIEKKCTEVKEVIRSHQKAAVGESAKILDQLKHDIAEMKRRDTELKQLSHNEDHIMFLQNTQALFTYPESEELPRFAVSPYKSFEALKESLNVLKTGMEGFLENAVVKVYKEAKITEIISPPEPQTREDFFTISGRASPGHKHCTQRIMCV
ncbi:E3 ubiquitin-protein ligase TRIM47-like [Denticeps clupeoides]|uniref:Uncharacterized protein n=1 Tax=Denticeps clupeoides TaxID=299321 RepID=A0AAY4E1B0_9TELE|nr:E3 ubiquitin-protein ligase TRIM47-like [Denticeps clupeoides]